MAAHCWLVPLWQSHSWSWVPSEVLASGTSRQRPEPTPLICPPSAGGSEESPPLSASRTAVYAAFLLPSLLNSNGVCSDRQESLSRTPQTVMPRQRETARQSLVTLA